MHTFRWSNILSIWICSCFRVKGRRKTTQLFGVNIFCMSFKNSSTLWYGTNESPLFCWKQLSNLHHWILRIKCLLQSPSSFSPRRSCCMFGSRDLYDTDHLAYRTTSIHFCFHQSGFFFNLFFSCIVPNNLSSRQIKLIPKKPIGLFPASSQMHPQKAYNSFRFLKIL